MTVSPINLDLPFDERVDRALHDRHLQIALTRAAGRMDMHRSEAMGAVDGNLLRDQMRQMKTNVLRNLPDLLEQFEESVTENGGKVHWASDATELNGIVLDIARRAGVQRIVKSKSMATEEVHLNGAIEHAGMSVVETDLGEYIIQLAGEPPSHIVAPVMHKRLEDISALFQRELDMPPTYDPEVICAAARQVLRKEFLRADMGISGCNFGIAETGTVCIVTNEGNGRLTSSMPRVYVVVMGIEKIVPTVEDAFLQYQALCRSATGQACSVYLSMTSGPRAKEDTDGPAEFHVVLLDNGRTGMLERGYGESLMCVRCGACLNVCPVYREIGGHAYGSTYSGPIGAVISPLLNMHVNQEMKLPFASTLCGACREACPVKIDLPKLLLDLRADAVQEGEASWFEARGMSSFATMMRSPALYASAGNMAGFGSNLLGWLQGGTIKTAPPPLNKWTRSRDFPKFAGRTFREQWAQREKSRQPVRQATFAPAIPAPPLQEATPERAPMPAETYAPPAMQQELEPAPSLPAVESPAPEPTSTRVEEHVEERADTHTEAFAMPAPPPAPAEPAPRPAPAEPAPPAAPSTGFGERTLKSEEMPVWRGYQPAPYEDPLEDRPARAATPPPTPPQADSAADLEEKIDDAASEFPADVPGDLAGAEDEEKWA